tara:strand:+ start:523 stop:1554 length:1032 start_codon:yes stop_codon:yes gene_type:complete
MFSSEEYLENINDIPTTWILEHYLNLPYKLTGQTVKIKSLFNVKDKDPSLVFYWWHDRYVFKDFSSGQKGSVIHAMMAMFNKNFLQTSEQIKKDYFKAKREGNVDKVKIEVHEYKWIADNIKIRRWNTLDAKYWTQYNINSNLLEEYCVKPLLGYDLIKEQDGLEVESFTNDVPKYVYGYFKKEDDTLYKIYRPFWKNRKFMTLDPNYIQGTEQLTKSKKFLIIASSMKDMLVLKSMNLKADVIAPNSENSMVPERLMNNYLDTYEAVVTLFDPDDAGIKAMKEYENKYQIPFCYIPFKNNGDLADMMKEKGRDYTLEMVIPVINRAVEKYIDTHKEDEDVEL